MKLLTVLLTLLLASCISLAALAKTPPDVSLPGEDGQSDGPQIPQASVQKSGLESAGKQVHTQGFNAEDVPQTELTAEALAKLEQELLQLSAELRILEEDLLYPPSSRLAVYLSLDAGEFFLPDAVSLVLNGKEVGHHLYTERQQEALKRGGVQRLFLGHARPGENELTAFFHGLGPDARALKRATSVRFEQSFEPVFVELVVSDNESRRQPDFLATVH